MLYDKQHGADNDDGGEGDMSIILNSNEYTNHACVSLLRLLNELPGTS